MLLTVKKQLSTEPSLHAGTGRSSTRNDERYLDTLQIFLQDFERWCDFQAWN